MKNETRRRYSQQHEVSPGDTQCGGLSYYFAHSTAAPLSELLYHSTGTIPGCNDTRKRSFCQVTTTVNVKVLVTYEIKHLRAYYVPHPCNVLINTLFSFLRQALTM